MYFFANAMKCVRGRVRASCREARPKFLHSVNVVKNFHRRAHFCPFASCIDAVVDRARKIDKMLQTNVASSRQYSDRAAEVVVLFFWMRERRVSAKESADAQRTAVADCFSFFINNEKG